jgi:DNA-binding transcriptional LysR family regulator
VRLNLYSLQLFVSVIDGGTIAAAAERENIATSALSKRISELERQVGTPLLIRRARGVEPTDAGLHLARGARVLLRNAEVLNDEMQDFTAGTGGHVRLAANLSSITQFVPQDLALFNRRYPRIQVDMEERVSSVVTQRVLDNAADIGIFTAVPHLHGLTVFPYRRDRMVLVAPASHPLARHDAVTFEQTLDFDHVGMHRGSAANEVLMREAAASNRTLRMRYQVTSYDAMIAMVKAEFGVGLMPGRALNLYSSEGLATIQLLDSWADRELKLCIRSDEGLHKAAQLLLEHLRDAVSDTPI